MVTKECMNLCIITCAMMKEYIYLYGKNERIFVRNDCKDVLLK